MSHFVVAVVTKEPTDQAIQEALAPFHEYECTGHKDQYVVPVDKHDEYVKTWETGDPTENGYVSGVKYIKHKETGVLTKKRYGRAPKAFLALYYNCLGTERVDDYDYRADGPSWPTHSTYYKLKPEYEEITKTYKEDGMSLEEYMREHEGCGDDQKGIWWDLIDGRYHQITNPNAKWDWYVKGGRYSGKLLSIDNKGDRGEGGAFNSVKKDTLVHGNKGTLIRRPFIKRPVFDQVQVKKLDVEAMRDKKRREYTETYHEVKAKYAEYLKTMEEGPARVASYWAGGGLHPVDCTLEEFLEGVGTGFTAWAILDEGVWMEDAEMGWFGMSIGERNQNQWVRKCSEWFDELIKTKPDHYLTMIDCHI